MKQLSIRKALQSNEEIQVRGIVKHYRNLASAKFIILLDATGELQVTIKPVNYCLIDGNINPNQILLIQGTIQETTLCNNGVELIPTKITKEGKL